MKQRHNYWEKFNDKQQQDFDEWMKYQTYDPTSPFNFARRFLKFCFYYALAVLTWKYFFGRSRRDAAQEEYMRQMHNYYATHGLQPYGPYGAPTD